MRKYLVFGSSDTEQIHWKLVGAYEASGADQARRSALIAAPEPVYAVYAAVPERNWQAASPSIVTREPVVRWEGVTPGQMTVEDVLQQAEEAGLVEKVPSPDERMTRRADTAGL